MHIKQYIALRTQRMAGHLKSIGLLVWVPIIVVDLLLPAIVLFSSLKRGITDELRSTLLQLTQLLIPLFSAWWAVFVLKEYIEADGNELLYVCKNRCKLSDVLQIFLLYIGNIAVLYALCTAFLFPDFGIEFLRIFCACLWYFGLMYGLCYLSKSITITIMALLLYTLANASIRINNVVFPMYYSSQAPTQSFFLRVSIPLAVGGILLLILGVYCNKKSLKFN